jgi:hypothetical protein
MAGSAWTVADRMRFEACGLIVPEKPFGLTQMSGNNLFTAVHIICKSTKVVRDSDTASVSFPLLAVLYWPALENMLVGSSCPLYILDDLLHPLDILK